MAAASLELIIPRVWMSDVAKPKIAKREVTVATVANPAAAKVADERMRTERPKTGPVARKERARLELILLLLPVLPIWPDARKNATVPTPVNQTLARKREPLHPISPVYKRLL